VSGCPHRQQGTIATPRGLGENGFQQACESHFHHKRCGCEAAMARERECSEHEDGASVKVESTEKF
jgi:hypothetical protein